MFSHGERITRYLGDYSAVLDLPAGKGAVLNSNVPLRAERADGSKAPVDLTLRRSGDGWSPLNPAVGMSLAGNLADGFEVAGFDVRLVGADAVPAQVSEGRAFFANALTDTDFVVVPTVRGATTFLVLRSPESPTSSTLAFDLPAGAVLRPTPKPLNAGGGAAPGSVEIVQGGETLATIPSPVAYDAQGKSLGAHLRVQGSDRLTVALDQDEQDVAYPVLLDPAISGYGRAGGTYEGWWNLTEGYYYGTGGPGQTYVRMQPSSPPIIAHQGMWWSQSHNSSSYIYQAQYAGLYHTASGSAMITGLWCSNCGGWEPGNPNSTSVSIAEGTATACARAGCAVGGGTPNSAGFGIYQHFTTNTTNVGVTMYSTQVFESDDNNPSVPAATRTLAESSWYDTATDSVSVSASDAGLGMDRITVSPPPHSDRIVSANCSGGYTSRCPGSLSGTVSYGTNGMNEGRNTVTATARDIIQRTSSRSWKVKVDRSAPNALITGDGWDGVGGFIPPGGRSITVTATDGSTTSDATQRSGVASIEIKVDGARRHFVSQSPADSQGMNTTWTYNTDEYEAGEHTIEVIVKDRLGHPGGASKTVLFGSPVPPEWPRGCDEGAVTVADGYFGGPAQYAALKVQPDSSNSTVHVCWQLASLPTLNVSGVVAIRGASIGSGGVNPDNEGGACMLNGGTPLFSNTGPEGTTRISYYTLGGTAPSELWLCFEAPGVSRRVILTVPSGTAPEVRPYLDQTAPAPPLPKPWPAKPSAACNTSTGSFLVNGQVASKHVWLANGSLSANAKQVCVRQQDAGSTSGNGGVVTIDHTNVSQPAGVDLVDMSPCTQLVRHIDAPFKLHIDESPGGEPKSVCVNAQDLVKARIWASTNTGGNPVAFTPDP